MQIKQRDTFIMYESKIRESKRFAQPKDESQEACKTAITDK